MAQLRVPNSQTLFQFPAPRWPRERQIACPHRLRAPSRGRKNGYDHTRPLSRWSCRPRRGTQCQDRRRRWRGLARNYRPLDYRPDAFCKEKKHLAKWHSKSHNLRSNTQALLRNIVNIWPAAHAHILSYEARPVSFLKLFCLFDLLLFCLF